MADVNQERARGMIIDILNETPIKGDGFWELSLWAVIKRGNNFVEGVEVRFLCSAQEVGSDTTNSDGRTNPFVITIPAQKTSVQIEVIAKDSDGRSADRKKEIILPRPATTDRRADEWSTRVVGSEGDYIAYVSVTNQSQLPIPGILIHVYFDRGKELVGHAYTNNDGLASISIKKFIEPYKDIIIEAVGTRIKPEPKRLYQRHEQSPPPVPEPPDPGNTYGFGNIFKIFKSGWESGEQAKDPKN